MFGISGIKIVSSAYLLSEGTGYFCGDTLLVHLSVKQLIDKTPNWDDVVKILNELEWKFGPDLNAVRAPDMPMVTVGPQIDPDKITILSFPWY